MSGPYSPARQPKKRSPWLVGGATIVSFVGLLYVVQAFDQLDGHRLDDNGIRPLETDGLWGILLAPLLHANWAHLAANTGPALVLGFLVTLAGLSRFLWATAIIWIVGGFGTWLIGNMGSPCGETDHIGASGLIFGWLTFLLVFGFFIRSGWQITSVSWCWSSTAACCGGPCRCSTFAAACRGRDISAVESPGCWPLTCCPARNAKLASFGARGPDRPEYLS